jgi:predicted flavoprotein YhiN
VARQVFTAINIVEKNPKLKVAIERGADVLQSPAFQGRGRCNVTHACFDPNELVYPRGEKELRGPFHQFWRHHRMV